MPAKKAIDCQEGHVGITYYRGYTCIYFTFSEEKAKLLRDVGGRIEDHDVQLA